MSTTSDSFLPSFWHPEPLFLPVMSGHVPSLCTTQMSSSFFYTQFSLRPASCPFLFMALFNVSWNSRKNSGYMFSFFQ